MDRKINWITGCHDEIELVYEKAEQNESIGMLLSELEQMALTEAVESCGLLSMNGRAITREMVLGMSERDKETVMYYLSGAGLVEFNPSMSDPIIVVKFSPHIQNVLGCTLFSVLNRIEKIDGAYNVVRFPKATLELQLPLGGRKGMLKWEMLIMQLYPWLSVSDKSYNVVADGLLENNGLKDSNDTQPIHTKVQEPAVSSKGKKGLFSKLFGK